MKFDNITPKVIIERVRMRHAKLRALGLCIGGSLTGAPSKRTGRVHGPVVQGGRCAACLEAKR